MVQQKQTRKRTIIQHEQKVKENEETRAHTEMMSMSDHDNRRRKHRVTSMRDFRGCNKNALASYLRIQLPIKSHGCTFPNFHPLNMFEWHSYHCA